MASLTRKDQRLRTTKQRSCELTQFAELAVAKDKGSKSAKAIEGLVAVLLCGVFVDRSIRCGGITAGELLCLPNEVLKEVALVLCEEQELGLLDDRLEI